MAKRSSKKTKDGDATVIYAYSAVDDTVALQRQILTCSSHCAQSGWPIVQTVSESGGDRRRRSRLLNDADRGKFQQIVVSDPDRLGRIDLVRIISRLRKAGVRIEACDGALTLDFLEAALTAELALLRDRRATRRSIDTVKARG